MNRIRSHREIGLDAHRGFQGILEPEEGVTRHGAGRVGCAA